MKKLICLVNLFVLLFVCSSTTLYAQWLPEVKLTNSLGTPKICLNNSHPIAVNKDSIHVVFTKNVNNLSSVFYKRSVDGGVSWTPDILISGTLDDLQDACVAVDGQRVHAVWTKLISGAYEVHYRQSTNGGTDWRPVVTIQSNTSIAIYNPSIAVSGAYVYLSWQSKFSSAEAFISFRASSNYGSQWNTLNQLTVGDFMRVPAVCADGSKVYVIFPDDSYDHPELSLMRSTNGGASFLSKQRITDNTGASLDPSAACSGDTVFVTWIDNTTGTYQVYFKRSLNSGQTWQIDHKLTNSETSVQSPNICASGPNVHLVWSGNYGSEVEIFYLRGLYGGNAWQQISMITDTEFGSFDPSIAVSGNALNVLWTDHTPTHYDIFYKKNPTGNAIGITQLGMEIPISFELHQNYPNPFNPYTKIRFEIPVGGNDPVQLKIFDMLGREVRTLVNENLKPGIYEAEFNAAELPSGVYFYQISCGKFIDTKKMILVK